MSQTNVKTTVEFPVDEFNELIAQRFPEFKGRSIHIDYVIEEVGGDVMDRFPGVDQVTRVKVSFEGSPPQEPRRSSSFSSLAKQMESVEQQFER